LIDLVTQRVRCVFVDGFGETRATQALTFCFRFDLDTLLLEFATGDDVAIDLGGNLLHNSYTGRIVRRPPE
jgi:hypothetical protein